MECNGNNGVSANVGRRGNIILFYVVTGPPIGGALVYLWVLALAAFSSDFNLWSDGFFSRPIQSLAGLVGGFISILMFSYLLGGAQALLTGFAIAAASKRNGKFSYALAVIIPTIVGAIVMFLLAVTFQAPLGFGAFLGAIGIGASVMIRFIFRRRFRRIDS